MADHDCGHTPMRRRLGRWWARIRRNRDAHAFWYYDDPRNQIPAGPAQRRPLDEPAATRTVATGALTAEWHADEDAR
jgi:hypothetical protein